MDAPKELLVQFELLALVGRIMDLDLQALHDMKTELPDIGREYTNDERQAMRDAKMMTYKFAEYFEKMKTDLKMEPMLQLLNKWDPPTSIVVQFIANRKSR